ncbi:MAG TPA: hypothetical protein VNA04_08295 [Thermoanaerobaculia bacterium]|nr:hypothetical protein [Thermoanaerobaculia bacterium]
MRGAMWPSRRSPSSPTGRSTGAPSGTRGRDGFSLWERLLIDVLNPAYRWQVGFDLPVR